MIEWGSGVIRSIPIHTPNDRSMMEKVSRMTSKVRPDGFDVTCVIGRVTFDNDSPQSAYAAAFALIGENAQGTFTFPHEDGRMVEVEVTYR